MESMEEHIAAFNTKLQALLKKLGSLQKENDLLSGQVKALREAESSLRERTSSLEMQLMVMKASTEKLSGPQKADFEKRINKFIRDLDKCISILNL